MNTNDLFDNTKISIVSMEMLKPADKEILTIPVSFDYHLYKSNSITPTLYSSIFDNLSSKNCKKLFSTISKWKFDIFSELSLPVYKINSQQCFLISNEKSNATIKFSNLLIAFEAGIKRRNIASIRRLSGYQGISSGITDKTIPKHYYKDYTFSYLEVRDCLIKLLTFSLLELDKKMFLNKEAHIENNLNDVIFEINKHKRK